MEIHQIKPENLINYFEENLKIDAEPEQTHSSSHTTEVQSEKIVQGIYYDIFFEECKNRSNTIHNMLEQLKEIVPDIAMIQKTSMPIWGYLVQFIMVLEALLVTPEQFINIQWIPFRIGAVIDWLYKRSTSKKPPLDYLHDQKSSFLSMYQYVIDTIPHSIEANMQSTPEVWFVSIKYIYEEYLKEYQGYQYLFSKIISGYDVGAIESPVPGSKELNLVQSFYKQYWDTIERGERSFLFKLNLNLVQSVQRQKDLSEITKCNKNIVVSTDSRTYTPYLSPSEGSTVSETWEFFIPQLS